MHNPWIDMLQRLSEEGGEGEGAEGGGETIERKIVEPQGDLCGREERGDERYTNLSLQSLCVANKFDLFIPTITSFIL